MKHCPQVEYRTKTEVPTEHGWYWARWKDEHFEIIPVYYNSNGRIAFLATGSFFDPNDFEFFGPLHTVKEG